MVISINDKDSLKNSSHKSTPQFCKAGEFARQGDVLHPPLRSSWKARLTSDKASYVAHGLALFNEMRMWYVVRAGRYVQPICKPFPPM
jgi:hypothetical protein